MESSTREMPRGFVLWLALLGLVQAAAAGREIEITSVGKLQDDFHYNGTLARTLVEYASAVYVNDLDSLIDWSCTRCNGLTKGFKIVEVIVDVQHCLQAYVGVAEDLRAIVIAFRGTQENSIQNWVEDLFFKQLDLNYPGVTGAMVHRGFYYAYHNTSLRTHVVKAVQSIQTQRDDLDVIVTGHSMGGAMGAFCALDLTVNYGVEDIQVVTFGQPRIGNGIFAAYFNVFFPNTYRITNGHDIVPHYPPYYSLFPQWTYHHFGREIWIHKLVLASMSYEVEQVCDSSGEDPTCSRSVSGNSIADHLCYFGAVLGADTWSFCGFVMQRNVPEKTEGALVFHLPLHSQDSSHTTS